MKCTIPEISWHNREPVLSVDIHPLTHNFYKLATGGGDCHVLIWQMVIVASGAVKQDLLSDLTRHQRAVNAVRWSPDGQYLATADDDANIIIWHQKTDDIPLLDKESIGNEVWITHKVLRGHKEDIYDLCWSPNSQKLLTGSIDNTAILWDFTKGKNDCILTEHKGFVQGVAWDPKGTYIATISTDRVLRIFDQAGRYAKARVSKGILPVPENHNLYEKEVKYFHDDTFKSFFRRLHFSPDGNLLVVPSGKVEDECTEKILYATYIFAVESWAQPVAILPNPRQCSTVVRCCPIMFDLRDDGPEPVIALPYRMVIAVGTDRDIILYDTQQLAPFARFRDVHYTRLTDITWSLDGRLLIASSTDGFCSLITFDPNEIGTQYVKEDSDPEDNPLEVSGCEELPDIVEDIKRKSVEITKPKKSRFLKEWVAKTPKKIKLDPEQVDKKSKAVPNSSTVPEIIDITDDDSLEKDTAKENVDTAPKAKRITPIPVMSVDQPTKDDVTRTASSSLTSASGNIKKRITPISVKCDKTNDAKAKLVAQPIAVRRKPRDNHGLSKPVNPENQQNDSPESSVEKTSDINDVKIDTLKLSDSLVSNALPDKQNTPSTSEKSNISEKETLDNSVLSINTSSGSGSKSKTPFKPGSTNRKSKQSEKRSNLKNNSLLKFLKSSSKETKKQKPSAKANLFGKPNDNEDDCIIMEDEARDAWKCNTADSQHKMPEKKTPVAVIDDVTEDFCLQIEDSSSQRCDRVCVQEQLPSAETSDKDNVSELDSDPVAQSSEVVNAKNKENHMEISDSTETETHSDSKGDTVTVQSNACKIEDAGKNIHKINRVPLITLSSPKNKKKE